MSPARSPWLSASPPPSGQDAKSAQGSRCVVGAVCTFCQRHPPLFPSEQNFPAGRRPASLRTQSGSVVPRVPPQTRQSLTCGHQLHDQLGVGDVGAANLGPTGPQALGWHHAAHIIYAKRITRRSMLVPPFLGQGEELAAPASTALPVGGSEVIPPSGITPPPQQLPPPTPITSSGPWPPLAHRGAKD